MTVIDDLIQSADWYPEKNAFIDQEKHITYDQLLQNTQRIATEIISLFSCVNEPIAVLIDHSIESICAFPDSVTGSFDKQRE